MITTEDSERISKLLSDTVCMLCKNSVHFSIELRLQGLLGIVIDGSSVILVPFTDVFYGDPPPSGSKTGEETGDSNRTTSSMLPRNTRPPLKLIGDVQNEHADPKLFPRDRNLIRTPMNQPRAPRMLALPAPQSAQQRHSRNSLSGNEVALWSPPSLRHGSPMSQRFELKTPSTGLINNSGVLDSGNRGHARLEGIQTTPIHGTPRFSAHPSITSSNVGSFRTPIQSPSQRAGFSPRLSGGRPMLALPAPSGGVIQGNRGRGASRGVLMARGRGVVRGQMSRGRMSIQPGRISSRGRGVIHGALRGRGRGMMRMMASRGAVRGRVLRGGMRQIRPQLQSTKPNMRSPTTGTPIRVTQMLQSPASRPGIINQRPSSAVSSPASSSAMQLVPFGSPRTPAAFNRSPMSIPGNRMQNVRSISLPGPTQRLGRPRLSSVIGEKPTVVQRNPVSPGFQQMRQTPASVQQSSGSVGSLVPIGTRLLSPVRPGAPQPQFRSPATPTNTVQLNTHQQSLGLVRSQVQPSFLSSSLSSGAIRLGTNLLLAQSSTRLQLQSPTPITVTKSSVQYSPQQRISTDLRSPVQLRAPNPITSNQHISIQLDTQPQLQSLAVSGQQNTGRSVTEPWLQFPNDPNNRLPNSAQAQLLSTRMGITMQPIISQSQLRSPTVNELLNVARPRATLQSTSNYGSQPSSLPSIMLNASPLAGVSIVSPRLLSVSHSSLQPHLMSPVGIRPLSIVQSTMQSQHQVATGFRPQNLFPSGTQSQRLSVISGSGPTNLILSVQGGHSSAEQGNVTPQQPIQQNIQNLMFTQSPRPEATLRTRYVGNVLPRQNSTSLPHALPMPAVGCIPLFTAQLQCTSAAQLINVRPVLGGHGDQLPVPPTKSHADQFQKFTPADGLSSAKDMERFLHESGREIINSFPPAQELGESESSLWKQIFDKVGGFSTTTGVPPRTVSLSNPGRTAPIQTHVTAPPSFSSATSAGQVSRSRELHPFQVSSQVSQAQVIGQQQQRQQLQQQQQQLQQSVRLQSSIPNQIQSPQNQHQQLPMQSQRMIRPQQQQVRAEQNQIHLQQQGQWQQQPRESSQVNMQQLIPQQIPQQRMQQNPTQQIASRHSEPQEQITAQQRQMVSTGQQQQQTNTQAMRSPTQRMPPVHSQPEIKHVLSSSTQGPQQKQLQQQQQEIQQRQLHPQHILAKRQQLQQQQQIQQEHTQHMKQQELNQLTAQLTEIQQRALQQIRSPLPQASPSQRQQSPVTNAVAHVRQQQDMQPRPSHQISMVRSVVDKTSSTDRQSLDLLSTSDQLTEQSVGRAQLQPICRNSSPDDKIMPKNKNDNGEMILKKLESNRQLKKQMVDIQERMINKQALLKQLIENPVTTAVPLAELTDDAGCGGRNSKRKRLSEEGESSSQPARSKRKLQYDTEDQGPDIICVISSETNIGDVACNVSVGSCCSLKSPGTVSYGESDDEPPELSPAIGTSVQPDDSEDDNSDEEEHNRGAHRSTESSLFSSDSSRTNKPGSSSTSSKQQECPRDWFCAAVGCQVVFRSSRKLAEHYTSSHSCSIPLGLSVADSSRYSRILESHNAHRSTARKQGGLLLSSEENVGQIPCPFPSCLRFFSSMTSLCNHHTRIHKATINTVKKQKLVLKYGGATYSCTDCLKKFVTKKDLARHSKNTGHGK